MDNPGLIDAVARMRRDGAGAASIATFERHYRSLAAGATGVIVEASIDPIAEPLRLADLDADGTTGAAHQQLARTVVIKLNGGLGTSMGLDAAKSLVPAKDGLTFLDITVRQILAQRAREGVALPLLFLNSFRTRTSTDRALAANPGLATPGLPTVLMQGRVPKLRESDLYPADWPADPELEWCPPGHGDLYTALQSSGTLQRLLAAGYRYAFCSNIDNLGATPDARIPDWMARHRIPFTIESCRRIAADRKGGHLAVRKADGRIILRDTAQTSPADLTALQDLDTHRYCSTNNIWIDLEQLESIIGTLTLPLIRNVKPIDPADAASPQVIQLESAMGAAVECFDEARTILVPRSRFVPVKTTNDLLTLRSDRYRLDGDSVLRPTTSEPDPLVDLDPRYYRSLQDFDLRFPHGPPALRDAERFVVRGDVTFEAGASVRGDVVVSRP